MPTRVIMTVRAQKLMAIAHAPMATGQRARLARIRMAVTRTVVVAVTNEGAIQTAHRRQIVSHVHLARPARPAKRVHPVKRVRRASHVHRVRLH